MKMKNINKYKTDKVYFDYDKDDDILRMIFTGDYPNIKIEFQGEGIEKFIEAVNKMKSKIEFCIKEKKRINRAKMSGKDFINKFKSMVREAWSP